MSFIFFISIAGWSVIRLTVTEYVTLPSEHSPEPVPIGWNFFCELGGQLIVDCICHGWLSGQEPCDVDVEETTVIPAVVNKWIRGVICLDDLVVYLIVCRIFILLHHSALASRRVTTTFKVNREWNNVPWPVGHSVTNINVSIVPWCIGGSGAWSTSAPQEHEVSLNFVPSSSVAAKINGVRKIGCWTRAKPYTGEHRFRKHSC